MIRLQLVMAIALSGGDVLAQQPRQKTNHFLMSFAGHIRTPPNLPEQFELTRLRSFSHQHLSEPWNGADLLTQPPSLSA
jgi:hypothetical protein